MNAAKRLQYIDGDVRLDNIVNSVIKESEVFFAISCFISLTFCFFPKNWVCIPNMCDVW